MAKDYLSGRIKYTLSMVFSQKTKNMGMALKNSLTVTCRKAISNKGNAMAKVC